MLGWRQRGFFPVIPFFLPAGVTVAGYPAVRGTRRWATPLACMALVFLLSLAARLLEYPYWGNPNYKLGEEYLLATHDAYHWIAGAEGFEFGVGRPLSEFARIMANLTGMSPANVGFWIPPFMGGLFAVGVFLWGWGLGAPYGGLCAGVLATLSPAFLARTLLGFYDNDFVVLLFAVILGLAPALWLTPWLATVPEALAAALGRKPRAHGPVRQRGDAPCATGTLLVPQICRYGGPDALLGVMRMSAGQLHAAMLAPLPLLALAGAGLFGWWMQDWHSLFPYLVRFSALIIPVLIAVLGPRGGRVLLLYGSLCYALPLLLGWPGLVPALGLVAGFRFLAAPEALAGVTGMDAQGEEGAGAKSEPPAASGGARLRGGVLWRRLFWHWLTIAGLWAVVVFFCLDADVFEAMRSSFHAYVNRSGDISSNITSAEDPLIFPSVVQSIIETQKVSFQEILTYLYPNIFLIWLAVFSFVVMLLFVPGLVWFVPLLALAFLSVRMGGRMSMFGGPALLLPLCLLGGIVCEQAWHVVLFWCGRARLAGNGAGGWLFSHMIHRGAGLRAFAGQGGRFAATLCVTLLLAWPLLVLVPDYTQGPVISHHQAEALAALRKSTDPEAVVWNWWDWGYATHHFARRHTIADGARHGGPSLFLPAAVYTTTNPRFARQLIKYTASKGNSVGKVFEGLSATETQALMDSLGDANTPLVQADGEQYLVVSFDILRIGVWISHYGSWNFVSKKGTSALMNNLSRAIEFNLEDGRIVPRGSTPVYAKSIDVFSPEGLVRNTYPRDNAYHFIFNIEGVVPLPQDETGVTGLLRNFWRWQRGYFSFTGPANDKVVVDDLFYDTLMVQLLMADPKNPRIAPYFSLVFDNMYTRVYRVR